MKKIAIIGAGEMTTIIACRAQELGIETHCFAWEKGATAKDDVDFFYPISIMEKDRILEKCKQIGIDGVIATTELTIPVAAYISNVMGLNGNPVEVAERITNKYKNRELCSQLTYLHNPKYNFVQSEEEIGNLFQKYPIILKPLEEGENEG